MGQGRLDTPGYFRAENMANYLKSYPIQICRASYPKIDLFNKMDLKNPTPTLPIDQGSKTRFLDLAGVSRKKKPIFSKIIKKNSEVQQILRPYETSPKNCKTTSSHQMA